ncbi:clavesin-2-like [Thrips palmi]|uniref:Clavesin-2-like n=1 Tax=Thrips palmi TaxID=161013 RepID=A0A6P8Y3R0_THRPL|nr:clavesin-2-like [Thrips palmi]
MHHLPPEWAEKARLELNEDPLQTPARLEELRQRLQEAGLPGHGDLCMDDAFYLTFLRARKFDVEKTVKLVRRYCEMRRRYPDVCRFAAASKHRRFHETRAVTVTLDRSHFEAPVIIAKIDYFDLSHITTMYVVRQYYTVLETCALDPMTQVSGLHLILDLQGINLKHVRMITPTFVSTVVSLTQESYPMRCRGVHVVNQPFGFEAIYALFKPFLAEKLRRKVHVHGSDWRGLHEHIPAAVLPHLYGGRRQGIDNGPWLKRLEAVEEAMLACPHHGC